VIRFFIVYRLYF